MALSLGEETQRAIFSQQSQHSCAQLSGPCAQLLEYRQLVALAQIVGEIHRLLVCASCIIDTLLEILRQREIM